MTKVHLITLVVVDHDDIGAACVTEVLENVNYPNDCIAPHVLETESREVEWSDDHPLNRNATFEREVARLFDPHYGEARAVVLELGNYERDNLLALLVATRKTHDTGDWHGQVRFKLKPELGPGDPNWAEWLPKDNK